MSTDKNTTKKESIVDNVIEYLSDDEIDSQENNMKEEVDEQMGDEIINDLQTKMMHVLNSNGVTKRQQKAISKKIEELQQEIKALQSF